MEAVKVWQSVEKYDLDKITKRIGIDAVDGLKRQATPTIWVRSAIHEHATQWLESEATRNGDGTIRDKSYNIANWIRFLHQRGETVFTATETDYWEYEASYRYPADGSPARSDNRWSNVRSSIKRFHEWLNKHYGARLPFELEPKFHPNGSGTVLGIAGGKRLTKAAPSVVPLRPQHLTALYAATAAPTPRGRHPRHPRRDYTFCTLLASTGMRINPTRLISVYEIPQLTGGVFQPFAIPGAVNKYKRGVLASAFANGIRAALGYIETERADIVEDREYEPHDPLHIVKATAKTVTYEGQNGKPVTRQWNDLNARDRRRLVTPEGQTAMLFVTSTGKPVSGSAMAKRVARAVKLAHAATPSFPVDAHPHSLRHTYATYMALLYYVQDPDLYSTGTRAKVFPSPDSAIKYVQNQLGHTSENTTRGYTAFIESLTDTDLDLLKRSI